MSLLISKDAADFFLARLPQGLVPIRLTTQKKPGCGDVSHKFDIGARKGADDTEVVAHGITILCNLYGHPEYENGSIELRRSPQGGIPFETIVVIPQGATLCGCGETARLPEKTVEDKK